MEATFEITLPDGRAVTEDDLAREFDALRPALDGADAFPATLLLTADAGEEGTAYSDQLEPLILRVCLGPVADLAAGRDTVVELYDSPDELRFAVEGDAVAIYEDGELDARFPLAELLPALVDCGRRYVTLVERLTGNTAATDPRLGVLRAAVDVAGASLT